MISDRIVEELTKVRRFIDKSGNMTFYLQSDEVAQNIKLLLNQWHLARSGYGPWIQDKDHWDHRHPDGIMFHHEVRGCPDLI